MRKLIISLLLVVVSHFVMVGQTLLDIRVLKPITEVSDDNDGRMFHPIRDFNDELCALIKVSTTHKTKNPLILDVGGLGVTHREEKEDGEIWFYVPNAVRNLRFKCHEYKNIDPIPVHLKPGFVYRIEFDCMSGGFDPKKKQNLVVNVFPKEAESLVEIDGMELSRKEAGVFSAKPMCGTHTVVISAPLYHTQYKDVILSDPESTHVMNVYLKQNFGWLTILGEGDLKVKLDDAEYTIPSNQSSYRLKLKSGEHSLIVTKPLYKPYQKSVVINDSTEVSLSPTFVPNFKKVTITVPNKDAVLTLNGKVLGKGSWSGDLEYGNYTISASMQGHTTTTVDFNFDENYSTELYVQSPTPKYGTVTITSNVMDAYVSIVDRSGNPKDNGKPNTTYKLLEGSYKIRVSKSGYQTAEKDITIKENDGQHINFSLTNIFRVNVVDAPSSATIYIDGKQKSGRTFDLTSGEHLFELKAFGYRNYKKHHKISYPNQAIHAKMAKRYYYPDAIYLSADAFVSMSGEWWGGLTFGGYYRNFNFEAGYQLLFSQPQSIYWSKNNYEGMLSPTEYLYTPTIQSYKVGYGIIILSRLRLTPQVGINLISLVGTNANNEEEKDFSSAFTMPVCGKLSFAISPSFDITFSTEYMIPIQKSELYTRLYDASERIQNWSSDLRFGLGLGFFF